MPGAKIEEEEVIQHFKYNSVFVIKLFQWQSASLSQDNLNIYEQDQEVVRNKILKS
jgi:hypothetical protein